MAEEPNQWRREQGFFAANSADIFILAIVVLCSIVFVLMVLTQWNMSSLVQDYFDKQAAAHPEPPRQPDIVSKPGEIGMFLYPSKPAEKKKSP
jgi:hypothetical protein